MAEESLPQQMEYRTCEICGEESARDEFADLAGHSVHKGLCFLEYGLIQNTMPKSGLRAGIEKFGALHRERTAAWRQIAEHVKAHEHVLEMERDRAVGGAIAAERQISELRAALFLAPCLCAGDFRCSRCKALEGAPRENSPARTPVQEVEPACAELPGCGWSNAGGPNVFCHAEQCPLNEATLRAQREARP